MEWDRRSGRGSAPYDSLWVLRTAERAARTGVWVRPGSSACFCELQESLPMKPCKTLALLSALWLLPNGAAAQLSSDPGFAVSNSVSLGGPSAYGSFPDGRYVAFDGLSFDLYASDGTWQANLGAISSFMWPSFVEVDPTGTFVIAGESTNGNLFKVQVNGSGVTLLANLVFNYDLDWDVTPGLAYVSAGLGGWGAGNDLVRLDVTTGSTTLIAHVQGPSGPIAVNAAGDVSYVTQYEGFDWPPPMGQESLIRWGNVKLDAGALLSETDADYLCSGLDGGSSMVSGVGGTLFLAHTNFAGDENEIYQFSPTGVLLDTVATTLTHVANLELIGAGRSTFSAQQPLGVSLRTYNTDFFSLNDCVTIDPARAQLTWKGPPSGVAGRGTFKLLGGEPGGFAVIMVASSSAELPAEDVIDAGWRAPLFMAVKATDILRRTQVMPLDAKGELKMEHLQTPAIEGQILLQPLLFDSAMAPLGSASHAINQ